MRSIKRLLPLALTAALLLIGAAVAQPPDQKQEFPRGFQRPAPLSVDDIVERIMSFDKNGDGKVTRDELPERMHFLIELGDTNKDGALDRDEIRKLAIKLAANPGGVGAVGFGLRTEGRFGPGPGPGPGPGGVEAVVGDLKLSGQKKDQAMAAARAHEENVRKLLDQERSELLRKMKEILSAEEFEDFKAALDRPRGGTVIVGPDAPRPGGR